MAPEVLFQSSATVLLLNSGPGLLVVPGVVPGGVDGAVASEGV